MFYNNQNHNPTGNGGENPNPGEDDAHEGTRVMVQDMTVMVTAQNLTPHYEDPRQIRADERNAWEAHKGEEDAAVNEDMKRYYAILEIDPDSYLVDPADAATANGWVRRVNALCRGAQWGRPYRELDRSVFPIECLKQDRRSKRKKAAKNRTVRWYEEGYLKSARCTPDGKIYKLGKKATKHLRKSHPKGERPCYMLEPLEDESINVD